MKFPDPQNAILPTSAKAPLQPTCVSSAFLWLGAGFFLLFCGGMIFWPEFFLASERSPRGGAMLHAAILGWLMPMAFGVVYLLLPHLGDPGAREGLGAKAHFFLHTVALCWMLPAFARWDIMAVAHSGLIMFCGLLICTGLTVRKFERGERLPMVQITVLSSLAWLLLTLFMGMLAAANYYWFILPMQTLTAIHAGMHAGFGGFFALLVMGVSYYVFDISAPGGTERRLWAFLLCNGGIYLTVLGLAFGLPILIVGALLVATGLIFYAVEMGLGLSLQEWRADAWTCGFAAGFVSIFLLVGGGMVLGNPDAVAPALRGRLGNLYGFLWIVLATGLPLWAIAGKMLAPGRGAARAAVPLLLYLAAAGIAAWGIVCGNMIALRAAGLLLLAGGAGMLAAILPACLQSLFAPRRAVSPGGSVLAPASSGNIP